MPQKLSAVELDEVSLVDAGANQKAKVVLMKRHDPTQPDEACKGTEMPCEACKGTGKVMEEVCKECSGTGKVTKCSEPPKVAKGVRLNIGFPEDGGPEVESVIFGKQWDEEKAVAWLKGNGMASNKVVKTDTELRYSQADAAGFQRFRVITPGANVGKSLAASQSFSRLQSLVDAAVREKFQDTSNKDAIGPSYIWIKDLFQDSVIFDQNGQTFRCDYTVDRDPATDEITVELSEPVPVEVVYQDVGEETVDEEPTAPPEAEVPTELLIKLGKLQARVGLLANKIGKMNRR